MTHCIIAGKQFTAARMTACLLLAVATALFTATANGGGGSVGGGFRVNKATSATNNNTPHGIHTSSRVGGCCNDDAADVTASSRLFASTPTPPSSTRVFAESLADKLASLNHIVGGIVTTGTPTVGTQATTLSLKSAGYTGTIPPQIDGMIALEKVHLGFNQLESSIPPEVGTLTDLIELSLYGNKLTGALPPELSNLTAITKL
jgi:Leucine-rich repeat (LRR) protein